MKYELVLNDYKGPLDKLLELVEEKKLEITRISLAEVTADFLKYLKKIEAEHADHGLIADFLSVASRLILIKSKVLLPALELTAEDESDIGNLEARLKIYAELKGAGKLIKSLWSEYPKIGAREFLSGLPPSFYPPGKLKKDHLSSSLDRIVEELQRFLKPVETLKIEVINLKTKIEEVFKKLTETPRGFRELQKGNSRSELVVLFLAVLHLIKEQLVHVEQESHFADIQIKKI